MAEQLAVNEKAYRFDPCHRSLNEVDVAWIAGLLEGEGSFFNRPGGRAVAQCAMTDQDVIEHLHELLGGTTYGRQPQKDHHKPSWHWRADGPLARHVIGLIYPYMGERRTVRMDEVLAVDAAVGARIDQRRQAREEVGRAAAHEYLTTDQSYRDLQKKYGISFVTIYNYVQKKKEPR